jgi:hypothetical protein
MDDDVAVDHRDSTLGDEWATQQVVLRFTANFDVREHGLMEEDFAPDGIWHQALGIIRGRDELRTRMAAFPPDLHMRHVLTNLRTTFVSPDVAVVDSYFTVYVEPRLHDVDPPVESSGAKNMGRYRDRLERIDGRWLIVERQPTFDFKLA